MEPQIIDYTTHPKGRKTFWGKIVLCPKCGRKGAYQVQGREEIFVHRAHQLPNATYTIADSCTVPIREY